MTAMSVGPKFPMPSLQKKYGNHRCDIVSSVSWLRARIISESAEDAKTNGQRSATRARTSFCIRRT